MMSRPNTKVLIVANPDTDSDSDPSPSTASNAEYRNIPPPPPLHVNVYDHRPAHKPLPSLATQLPHHPSNHSQSNPALSSPSSTSSHAVESTPPPSTPGVTAPPPDIPSEGPSSPEPVSGPSSNDYPSTRGKVAPTYKVAPPHSRQGHRYPHTQRVNTSPTSAPDSSNPSSASVSSEKIVILISTDSEHYQIVDITGLRDAAFIKERIFTKLSIYDEEAQAHFSIYMTQIAEFAIGEALTDDQLFEICRDRGDSQGNLKFFVSHSYAPVHELPKSLYPAAAPVQTIPPPVLPSNSYPPRPTHHRPPSPALSVSSKSESHPVDVPKGYEADVDNVDRERTKVVRPLPKPNQNPPPSPHDTRLPPAPSPSTHASPLSQPQRSGAPLPTSSSSARPPQGGPPPLSPNRPNFPFHDESAHPLHIRSGSDTATESLPKSSSRGEKPRESARRPSRPSNDNEDRDWVHVATPGTSRPNEREQVRTPQDGARSPPSNLRVRNSPSRYRHHLPIPKPPRNPPPAVPSANNEVRPPRLPGQPVPANWLSTYKLAGKTDKVLPTQQWPLGMSDKSKDMSKAKSMDNLRAANMMNTSPYANGHTHPVMLQPGGGARSRPPPQLPVTGGTGSVLNTGSFLSGTSLGQPKSYEGRSQVRPPPMPATSHGTLDPYSASRTNSSLMSPSSDPYARPQSALGESPSYSSRPRNVQSPVFGYDTQDSDNSRSPMSFSPHPQPPPGTLLPSKSDGPDRQLVAASPSSPSGREDTLMAPRDSDTIRTEENRWLNMILNRDNVNDAGTVIARPPYSSDGTLTSSTGTFMTYDDSDSENGTGTWKVPFKNDDRTPRPKSILRPPLIIDTNPATDSKHNSKHPTFKSTRPPPARRRASPSSSRTKQDHRASSKFTERIDQTWAPRPPPEDVYDNLEEFFPLHDLDKPVLEANSGGTSPINGDAVNPPVRVADKARVKGKKSIRIVAEEHKKKYRESHGDTASIASAVHRKRSTKLWGIKPEEVTTSQGKPTPSIPDSPGESPKEPKESFKWVRGELIGRGTYGRVYLAMNAMTGEMIAVKQVEIPPTASDKNDKILIDALKSESETLKDLDHPNIVQYLGFEETPQNLSIFLEYVPGGSIGSCLLKHGRFDEEVTKSFTVQILDGLDYLHSKGILHRDMKADNILVETSGICKISDFGISKRSDDSAHTALKGTVFWMAPEMIKAQEKGYSFKIDIWSVGCVVLEMWAGQRPWEGNEQVAVMLKLFNELTPPIPEDLVLSELAEDFRLKCFAIDPEQRPTAAELKMHPYLTLPPGWIFTGFK